VKNIPPWEKNKAPGIKKKTIVKTFPPVGVLALAKCL
jgi:hypothetical protein